MSKPNRPTLTQIKDLILSCRMYWIPGRKFSLVADNRRAVSVFIDRAGHGPACKLDRGLRTTKLYFRLAANWYDSVFVPGIAKVHVNEFAAERYFTLGSEQIKAPPGLLAWRLVVADQQPTSGLRAVYCYRVAWADGDRSRCAYGWSLRDARLRLVDRYKKVLL